MAEIPKEPEKPLFVPGIDKPRTVRKGERWVAVRGLDPAKDPRTISGWESRPIVASPGVRGNYTADIDSAAMEARDEAKEARMREARGLPPEE